MWICHAIKSYIITGCSSINLKGKSNNVYSFCIGVLFVPNDIIIEGVDYINEINENLTYLNDLYNNITSSVGNWGSNFFLSNSNIEWPTTTHHGFNGIRTSRQVEYTQHIQRVHTVNPFTNHADAHLAYYKTKIIINIFNYIIYFILLAGLVFMASYFRTRPIKPIVETDEHGNTNAYYMDRKTYEMVKRVEERDKRREAKGKGKKRKTTGGDEDDDNDGGEESNRRAKRDKPSLPSNSEDIHAINNILNYVERLGGWTHPMLRRFMLSSNPGADISPWMTLANDLGARPIVDDLLRTIRNSEIRRLLVPFSFPRIFLNEAEWQGYYSQSFRQLFNLYIEPRLSIHISPQMGWRYFPNAVYFPYGLENFDLDLDRAFRIETDFVHEIETEEQLRWRLHVPINVSLEEYIGLSWDQYSSIIDILRQ